VPDGLEICIIYTVQVKQEVLKLKPMAKPLPERFLYSSLKLPNCSGVCMPWSHNEPGDWGYELLAGSPKLDGAQNTGHMEGSLWSFRSGLGVRPASSEKTVYVKKFSDWCWMDN
jgi:hypothetical protein